MRVFLWTSRNWNLIKCFTRSSLYLSVFDIGRHKVAWLDWVPIAHQWKRNSSSPVITKVPQWLKREILYREFLFFSSKWHLTIPSIVLFLLFSAFFDDVRSYRGLFSYHTGLLYFQVCPKVEIFFQQKSWQGHSQGCFSLLFRQICQVTCQNFELVIIL